MRDPPNSMYWANFLHLYQPAGQIKEIFDKVANESYRPLVQSLLDNPSIKLTININGALSEQLIEHGYQDIIEGLRLASERGQIEFTDTAKYHPLLPFLPPEEIKRQIRLNRETNQKIFGPSYHPVGFFPPEMAYAPDLAQLIEELGYTWLIIDEIAFNGHIGQIDTATTYQIAGTKLHVFFRERSPSNLIMSALVRREGDFREIMKDDYVKKQYMITGMDGETFGHHRPGLQKVLTELMISKEFGHVFFSELQGLFPATLQVSPLTCTWASTEKDIEEGKQFLTWKDEKNQVHTWQWELQELALMSVEAHQDDASVEPAREKLDQALASDQFFWASARPWWSLEVIERGAWMLLDTIKSIPNIGSEKIQQAEKLYQNIIATIFSWQRTGHIRDIYTEYKQAPRVPFKTRTDTEPWVFDAFVELMKTAMQEAAKTENYEKAILWRDAIWKLETKNDIYDSIHAVDLLRKEITNEQILEMIEKYRAEYRRNSPGQPEHRS